MPQSIANIDPNYERRLRELREHAALEAAAAVSGEPVPWFRPAGWNGQPDDIATLGEQFSRNQANEDYLAACADPASPGTSGDLIATTTMIDYLASLEQGWRLRHTSRVRAVAHAAGRKLGQGSDTGPFVQNGVEFIRSCLSRARESPAEPKSSGAGT